MYTYLKGIVTEVESNYIALDVNGLGFLINTPNPYSFNEGEEYKVYVYNLIREDENSIYGFKTKEEGTELWLNMGIDERLTPCFEIDEIR